MYEAIGRPLELGSLRLKNRIVFAPTTLGLAEPQQEELLRRIAAGGSALAWVGDVPVGRKGFAACFRKKGLSTTGGSPARCTARGASRGRSCISRIRTWGRW